MSNAIPSGYATAECASWYREQLCLEKGCMALEYGYVLLQGYAGLTKRRVAIVGKTPKKYRIRALERTRLAGRNRYIEAGQEALVPRHAVALER